MKIYKEKISAKDVNAFLGDPFSDMIKFVVDIKKEIIAMGGELHSDAEALLIQNGSAQSDLWGGNLYPGNPKEKKIEFTSMINIRPRQNNRSMEIKDPSVKNRVSSILEKFLP
ncbi:MAG: hypothetical protein A3C47_04815 [Omnitrophica bacterium RIFCSPHIGHO2_02_FULL_51_18]|nr:MAG: hypothetical protein A3C47_04815 [Omnitrophica bacterium RIFCSPHIGHO2_02_FULL_51_18]